jgi:hypothetical protein
MFASSVRNFCVLYLPGYLKTFLTLENFYETVLHHIADGHAILRVMNSHISGYYFTFTLLGLLFLIRLITLKQIINRTEIGCFLRNHTPYTSLINRNGSTDLLLEIMLWTHISSFIIVLNNLLNITQSIINFVK